ncbi:MAG TPA: site-2 protease family protein [Chloroflexota bacterium]|jgi:Zn-dependent protease|nr:site-2 protease family protein [Chloroflexota bacterium]
MGIAASAVLGTLALHAGLGNTNLNDIINIILALLIAIDVHELGHAIVADRLGDDTPRRSGHLSLNPFRHMDQFGILMLFLLSITGTGFTYGYTPVDERALRRRTEFGPAIVALAGPLMNIVLAALIAIPLTHSVAVSCSPDGSCVATMFNNAQVYNFVVELFWINVFLGVFNLVPLPPLDGWTILSAFFSPKLRFELRAIVQYGPMILLLLFLFEPQIHFFSSVIYPIRDWVGNEILTYL